MNTKFLLPLFFFTMVLFCSCRNTAVVVDVKEAVAIKDGLITINLDNLRQGELPPFDSLFTGYEYVVNKDTFQVSGWEVLRFDGDENFIGINVPYSHINLYDRMGNFIRRIGQQGMRENKGEFWEFFNYCIDPTHKMVYILANKQGKVFKYNYNGDFLGMTDVFTTPIDRNITEERMRGGAVSDLIACTPQGNLLVHYAYWSGNIPYNFYLFDGNNQIIASKKTMGKFNAKTRYMVEAKSYVYNECLHVIDFSDTAYVIKNQRFIPKYVFEQKYSLAKIVDSLGEGVNIYEIEQPVYQISNMRETDQYLFFSYVQANRKYLGDYTNRTYACYHKPTKQAFKICTEGTMKKWTKDSIRCSILTYQAFDKTLVYRNKEAVMKVYLK